MNDYSLISVRPNEKALIVDVGVANLRDADVCQLLREELVSAAENGKLPHVILNLQEVRFIGSVGILGFLGVRKVPSVDHVYLCHLDDRIHELFKLCRLISNDPAKQAPFDTAGTVDDALAAIIE